MRLCRHLEPILKHLESRYNLAVVNEQNGKSWGFAVMVDGPIPYGTLADGIEINEPVSVSAEHRMITCGKCWTNIVEHATYERTWL